MYSPDALKKSVSEHQRLIVMLHRNRTKYDVGRGNMAANNNVIHAFWQMNLFVTLQYYRRMSDFAFLMGEISDVNKIGDLTETTDESSLSRQFEESPRNAEISNTASRRRMVSDQRTTPASGLRSRSDSSLAPSYRSGRNQGVAPIRSAGSALRHEAGNER